MASQVICSATEWSKLDPNQTTSTYVQNLIAQADNNDTTTTTASRELDKLFNTKRIEFGTAGLRARMQPGASGMNDLIVIQTAQGLAKYVLDANNNNNTSSSKAVVGYDHRSASKFNLSSKQFAIYTKLVFQEAGIECILLDGYVATPILAFAVRHLTAAVGVMVTASHNPKQDDGYKVYWNDGCQIRPPVDKNIAQSIIKDENLKPWIDYGAKLEQLKSESNGQECYGLSDSMQTKQIEDAYFASIKDSGLVTDMNNGSTISLPKFAYTAMHGVGTPYAKRSFEVFNLPPFCTVPSQEKPDANFPTVSFPNPEEKGALDEAMAFSIENDCDVVLANDPDADRLGVAEYNKEGGQWTIFTGDQIATLLGCWLWETIGKSSDQPVAMLASTVSSKMLGAVAQAEGFHFEETLTGFKWIGNRVNTLQEEGYRVLLGYEEAIGFACAGVPDKDGISALGVIATLATSLYSNGETLTSHLQKLHDSLDYGGVVTSVVAIVTNKLSVLIMQLL